MVAVALPRRNKVIKGAPLGAHWAWVRARTARPQLLWGRHGQIHGQIHGLEGAVKHEINLDVVRVFNGIVTVGVLGEEAGLRRERRVARLARCRAKERSLYSIISEAKNRASNGSLKCNTC